MRFSSASVASFVARPFSTSRSSVLRIPFRALSIAVAYFLVTGAYPLSDIEDADYENGRIVFDYVDGAKFSLLESTKNDDIPLLASFSEDDSKRFVAAVKARKS